MRFSGLVFGFSSLGSTSHLVVHIHALNGARKKMKERINDDDEKAYRDVTQRSQKEHPKDQEAPSVTRR
jgi:hypothetical protein